MKICYQRLAVWLNHLENHRTDGEWERALVIKIFAFSFVNSYNSMFCASPRSDLVPTRWHDGRAASDAHTSPRVSLHTHKRA